MPFEFTNALATCQQMINNALRDLLDVTVVTYLNDILVYSEDSAKHECYDLGPTDRRSQNYATS